MWYHIRWSLTALVEGFFPKINHMGDPWDPVQELDNWMNGGQQVADGKYCGALAVVCGDMEYLSNHLGFPH